MDERLSRALQTKHDWDADLRADDYSSAELNEELLLQDHYAVNSIIRFLNQAPIHANLPELELHDDKRPLMDQWAAAIVRAQGVVGDMAEVAAHLRPVAPTLPADALHPWVWLAADPFWQSGHFAAAVESAAKALTAFVQQKSGSVLADRELVTDVFAPKAKEQRVRLWLPGDRNTDTWKSRQEGLHHLAMGAYAGIRNVAAHSVDVGWTQQQALEFLAVLSTVARWAEETARVVEPDS